MAGSEVPLARGATAVCTVVTPVLMASMKHKGASPALPWGWKSSGGPSQFLRTVATSSRVTSGVMTPDASSIMIRSTQSFASASHGVFRAQCSLVWAGLRYTSMRAQPRRRLGYTREEDEISKSVW